MSMIVLGAVFVDIKGYPSSVYLPRGRNAGRVEFVHGGVSRNIAEDLGNIGLNPVFLSLVDETGVGSDVLARLEAHQVDTRYMRRVPEGMGTWLAVFDNNNDVCASISHRPDLTPLLASLQENGPALFARADSVLLELDMEQELVEAVFSLAEAWHVPVFAAVSNMSIALERRKYANKLRCLVCNRSEAELLFSTEFADSAPEVLAREIAEYARAAELSSIVVTLGGEGAVWADENGKSGYCPAWPVPVSDTTGAGDAFFAGVSAGLSYGKTLPEACEIGPRLAASVICTLENTCPRFLPAEFGLNLNS